MKKRFCIIVCFCFWAMYFLIACSQVEYEETSYWDYENMETVTIEDNKITLVLYENQALPYRWTYMATDEKITLVQDSSVDKNDMTLQAGVSDSYRVLVFECGEVNEARLYLRLERITAPKNVIEKHRYRITYENERLICEEIFME